jgi:hypothetical protein
MKVYLAAQFARQQELLLYRDQLIKMGIEITSRWLTEEKDPTMSQEDHLRKYAQVDRDDVLAADVLVFFSEAPPSPPRGGRHVEFGIALQAGKQIVVIGPKENIFHHLQSLNNITHVITWTEALVELAGMYAKECSGIPRVSNAPRGA